MRLLYIFTCSLVHEIAFTRKFMRCRFRSLIRRTISLFVAITRNAVKIFILFPYTIVTVVKYVSRSLDPK